MRDYLLSNGPLLAAFQPLLDAYEARGGDPEILRPLIGVQPSYLEASLAEMRRTYGTIERYFGEALGLDFATRRAIRSALVDPG